MTNRHLGAFAAALLSVLVSVPAMSDNTGITTQVPPDAGGPATYAASVSAAGPATTATALAANGANCSASSFPLGVDASGAVESCSTSISGNAGTATALAANGANCSAGSYPLGVDASGAVESCTVASGGGGITGSVGTTDNGIPRADGTGGSTLQASTVTIDDSGYLTATRFQVDGSFAAFRNDGGYVRLDTQLNAGSFSRGSVWHVDYPSVDAEVRLSYCWANDYDWQAAKDLCVKRTAAGVFEVNGGSTSTGGAIYLRPLTTTPTCVEGTFYYDSSDHDFCDCVGASPAYRSRGGAGACTT